MPDLILEYKAHGKKYITIINNISQIADALKISVLYPIQFMGFDLGTMSRLNKKLNNAATLKGRHSYKTISDSLAKFINLYVICPHCDKPELQYNFEESSFSRTCDVCGHTSEEPNHRLDDYILKHPMSISNVVVEKKKKRKQSKKQLKQSNNYDWNESSLTTRDTVIVKNTLIDFITTESPEDILKNILNLQKINGFDKTKRMNIILNSLFGPKYRLKHIVSQLKEHHRLLQYLTSTPEDELLFINCLKQLIKEYPKIIKILPIILEICYDNYVLSPESILDNMVQYDNIFSTWLIDQM